MFGIQRNNQWLKINPETTLSITLYSQLMNEGKLRGPLSIPLDIPIAGNELFLDGIELLKGINAGTRMNAGIEGVKLYIQGVWWLYGKIAILNVTDNSVSVNLIMSLPGITTLDKKLQELPWDTINLPSDPNIWDQLNDRIDFLNAQANYAYDATDVNKSFNFPLVKNSIFYGLNNENNLDYQGIINNYDEQIAGGFIKNEFGNWNAIVPMVYVLEILRKIFTAGGYYFNFNSLPSYFRKLIQFNNYDLCKLRSAYKANAEISSSFTCNGTGVGGVAFVTIPASNITQDDFIVFNVLTPGNYGYKIKRSGKYQYKITLEWSAPLYQYSFLGELTFVVYVPGTSFSVQCFEGNILAVNNDTVEFLLEVSEDGKTINYEHSSPGFPPVTGSYTLSSGTFIDKEFYCYCFFLDSRDPSGTLDATITAYEVQVANLSHPLINHLADSIDLSKCVPQDVVSRDFVNAFASTFNVEFVIDENLKTVTALLNEPDMIQEPVHLETIWQANSEAPTTNYRPSKWKSLAYRFDGGDELLIKNFTPIILSESLGEFGSYEDLILNYPPDVSFILKKAKVWNEACWYICQNNKETKLPEWVPYSDDYAPYSVGSGDGSLELGMSPILMRHHSFENFTMAIPSIEMSANSHDFKLEEKETGLRMMFLVGKCKFSLVIGGYTNMPYSTVTNYPYLLSTGGPSETIGFSFEFYREYLGANQGIYNLWEKTFSSLNLVRQITKKLSMRIDEILNWSFRKRIYMNGAVLVPEQITLYTKVDKDSIDIEAEFGIEEVELL